MTISLLIKINLMVMTNFLTKCSWNASNLKDQMITWMINNLLVNYKLMENNLLTK